MDPYNLTERQKDLLRAIVELYVKMGEPVGSENVEKAYNLGVSPATIRNEMVRLTELGLLKQPHTSAGRIPTTIGFRIYISTIMKEKELPISAEVKIKEDLWQLRYHQNKLLKEAVRALASRCQMLGIAVSDEGDMIYAGAANILDFPEFEDIDVARFVLGLFDEYPMLQGIIRQAAGSDPLHILFGDELGYEYLIPTSFVFYKFTTPLNSEGVIGVIGPARMNFPVVIPYVRYTAGMIEQALRQ
jgi:heat-inducible transcriptional repressor